VDDLTQGLRLAEALLGHPVLPGRQGNGVVNGECGEQRIGIVPKVGPLLSPPLHQSGQRDVEIRIDAMA
jgi:hypothetical protein